MSDIVPDEDGLVEISLTPIEVMGVIQMMYRLDLEVKTGMKFRQSTLATYNRWLAKKFGAEAPVFTKKKPTLEHIRQLYAEIKAQNPPRNESIDAK